MGRRSDVCGGEGAWGEEVTYVEGDVCEHCAHTPAHRANVSMLNWNGKEGRSEGGKEGRSEGGREGGREGGSEGRREGGREGECTISRRCHQQPLNQTGHDRQECCSLGQDCIPCHLHGMAHPHH